VKRLLAALTVRTKLFVLISACVLGFSAFGWLAFTTLSLVKVNGPYYQRIAQSKDLIADILPPPEYIIESYLVAMQMADTEDAAQLTALAEKSQTLRKDFETRHTFWLQELSADALRETLVVTAYQPAVDFFNLWEQAFLPALRRGDRAQARTVLREAMAPKYEEHRAAIDTVVTMATQRNKEDEQAAADIIAQVTRVLIACGVGAVVFLVCCGWSIARAITKPLRRTVMLMQDIADGEGDLTKRLEVSSRDELGELAMAFNSFVNKLHDVIAQVQSTAVQVSTASRELSAVTEHVSRGAQEQAASLEETAASLEQITSTVESNVSNARQASQIAAGSRDAAEQGGQVVAAAVSAMSDISTSSKHIADITAVIDGIAFQTNLLALNAAVEAARAGEQGRGFAVVASEVRNLAQRSATAAQEITRLIQDSVQKVQSGAALVNRSGAALEELVTSAKRVTDIIAETVEASQEQSLGLTQVNQAVTQLDHVTQTNAAQVEQLTSTAQGLSQQAESLEALVRRFKLAQTLSPQMVSAEVDMVLTSPHRGEAGGGKPARARRGRAPAAA